MGTIKDKMQTIKLQNKPKASSVKPTRQALKIGNHKQLDRKYITEVTDEHYRTQEQAYVKIIESKKVRKECREEIKDTQEKIKYYQAKLDAVTEAAVQKGIEWERDGWIETKEQRDKRRAEEIALLEKEANKYTFLPAPAKPVEKPAVKAVVETKRVTCIKRGCNCPAKHVPAPVQRTPLKKMQKQMAA